MAVSSAEAALSPVLRQKTFLWAGVAPLLQSQLSSIQGGYALGSADGASALATSALLLPIPDWSTAALGSPWLIDQASFPGLAAAMGGPSGALTAPISLLGSALTIDPASNTAILALLAEAQGVASQTLLLGLGQLASAPSVAWSTLLPDEQIQRLLLSTGSAGTNLITVGTSQAGDGALSTRYPLLPTGPAQVGVLRTYLAGPTDIQAKAADGVLLPATTGTTRPAVVEVGLASAPTTTGLVPSGGSDVLVSALDQDGRLLWERLFGNSSTEQQPRLAVSADGAIVVAATLQGSLGLNPAGGGPDIGLASYSPDGALLWRRLLGDAGNQQITDLSVGPDGTILVLGLTSAAPGTSGSPRGLYGQAPKGDGSDVDSFLTAYSPQGDRLWTYQFGSAGEDLALAMDWMPRASSSTGTTDTLVVVGSQATAADPDTPKAWVELLELPSRAAVANAFLPPPPPSLDWGTNALDPTLGVPLALIRRAPGATAQLLLQGDSEPGSSVQVRTSLSSATTTATADAITGRWTLALDLPQLTTSQLGQGFVLLEARDALGLVSDTSAVPVLFTGTGLPGELPQLLAIDPDGTSGAQPAALLQRQITVLGDGPLTVAGQRLLVDYSGTLTNGTPFDSSLNPGRRPFDLTLGAGRVITGWDQGLQGLPMGSQVQLVIPPSLAYGDRATDTIPAGSTLTFSVDLRADLSIPELFLRDLVWPQLFAADASYTSTNTALLQAYNQDLLGLALSLGPGDGSVSADVINLAQLSGFPISYPLLAMGGGASDTLTTSGQQSSLLFGEAGNDQLRSAQALYAFLDGGSGNDRLESQALISWLRGGNGTDTAVIPTGNWRLQRTGTVAGDPWRELGLLDASGQLLQLLQLQSVEQISLSGTTAKATDLLQLLADLTTEVVDAAALTTISGSADALVQVYAAAEAGRISGLGNVAVQINVGTATVSQANAIDAATTGVITATISDRSIEQLKDLTGTGNAYSVTVTDTSVDAALLNTLDGKTTVTVNATGVNTLTGLAAERNKAFHAQGLSLALADDQAPSLLQVGSVAGSYGANRTISLTLQFDEPVRWQSNNATSVPVLQLSNGLEAAWVAPAPGASTASTEQRFDLLTGQQPPAVSQLQVLGLAGLGQFTDIGGNAMATPQPSALSLSQVVSISPWNLDVDGDGAVTPLGDGLMIIRKLFGNAFANEALTAKAVSPNASRSTTAIHDYIQQGIQLGLLDVDRDGRTTPLGDGLMVIRQLFGNAFSGESLINKAISDTSSLIPQGQALTSLDAAGRLSLANQVRQQISALMP